MTVEVTIGVCLKNGGKAIVQIADRIKAQDFPHGKMELLFVDDGSDDNTLSVISQVAPGLNMNYKVFHHSWKGLGYSRNVVIDYASGDYIVWVDDGTIIPKNYVRKHVEFLKRNPNVGIVRGYIGTYKGQNRISTLENMIHLAFSNKYAGTSTTKLPGASGSIYRIRAVQQVGGFQKDIRGAGEDTDVAYRILKAGWKIFITKTGFLIDYNTNFRQVWKKNFWYGYGAHFTIHKHNELRDMLYKSTPIAGFVEGLLVFSPAYKTTRKKIALFLPIFYFVKKIAWNIGFVNSHFDLYGHK